MWNFWNEVIFSIFWTIIALSVSIVVLCWSVSYIIDQIIDIVIVFRHNKEVINIPPDDESDEF